MPDYSRDAGVVQKFEMTQAWQILVAAQGTTEELVSGKETSPEAGCDPAEPTPCRPCHNAALVCT